MSDPASLSAIPNDKSPIPDLVPEALRPERLDLDAAKDLAKKLDATEFVPDRKLDLSRLYTQRPEYQYLPPTRFQPYVGITHSWTNIGGVPDGIHNSTPEMTDDGTYEATFSGVTTAYNKNPEAFLGFEYRNWDLANSPRLQDRHVYRQIGPTLGIRTQFGKYRVSDYAYTAVLDPSSIEAQMTESSQDVAIAAAAGDYGSLSSILSTMFDGIDMGSTVYGYDSTEYYDAWRWQLDGRIGAGSAVYHAQSPVGVFEHFDIGVTGTMTTMNEKFFLGIGMYSDVGIIRIGHNPRVEFLAEGLLRYHSMPSSSESYMVEAGVGFNLRTAFDFRKKNNPE